VRRRIFSHGPSLEAARRRVTEVSVSWGQPAVLTAAVHNQQTTLDRPARPVLGELRNLMTPPPGQASPLVLGLRRGLVDQEARVLYQISQLRDLGAPGSCGFKLHLCLHTGRSEPEMCQGVGYFLPGNGVIFRM
jgi:hypothetical protein